jgi:hypothetical protein
MIPRTRTVHLFSRQPRQTRGMKPVPPLLSFLLIVVSDGFIGIT